MTHQTDKPLAIQGLISYRYRKTFGWVMIGAKNHSDALREAGRSITDPPMLSNLQMWNGRRYADIGDETR